MNLSEPFHVTNGVRPGGVLRPYFLLYIYMIYLWNQATLKLGIILVKSYLTT